MSESPLRLAGLEHLVKLSASVEVQLSSPEHEPLKAVLALAREDAADAIEKLLIVDPFDPQAIQKLQHDAGRYGSLVEWLRSIVTDGREADVEVTEARAEQLREIVLDVPEETRTALGIKDPGPGSE